MAKKAKVTVQKVKGFQAAPPPKKGDTITEFTLLDNGSGTFVVHGHTQGGTNVSIKDVADLVPEPVSSDPAVVGISNVNGDAFDAKAQPGVTSGTVNVIVTATWRDGSIGPFSIELLGTVAQGPVTGIGVTFVPA